MDNATLCIEWVLRQEDATLAGKVVDLGDGAGLTRFGITRVTNPPADFYTKPAAEALTDAIAIYRAEFWNKLMADEIAYLPLAASLLSFAINDGEAFDARMIQRIVGVDVDGVIGPATIAAINNFVGPTVLQELQDAQAAHYRAVAKAYPEDEKYLDGWLKRAQRTYPSLT